MSIFNVYEHKFIVKVGMTPYNVINSKEATPPQKNKFAFSFDSDSVAGYSQKEADISNATLITDRSENILSDNDDSLVLKTLDSQAIKELELEFKNGKKSQVKNKYWQGDEYLVIQKDNKIKVLNCKTYQKSEIDLEKLTEGLSGVRKILVLKSIRNMPAEVLEDISNELQHILHKKNKGAAAVYNISKDNIELNTLFSLRSTLVHELGHAVDYMKDLNISSNRKFYEIFESELNAFTEAGYEKCGYTYDWEKKEYNYTGNTSYSYCTSSELEMFAECYSLLMTGHCQSAKCIKKYFPKTLEAVKQELKYIRSQPKSERCFE